MAAVKPEAKEVTEEAEEKEVEVEAAAQEEAIFGFNDRRYGDLQLRLVVSSDPSALIIHGGLLQDNHSPVTTVAKLSESGGNNVTVSAKQIS